MSISSPQIWKEFFQNYYSKELNKLAGKILSGKNDRSLYVDVSRDLTKFKEGVLARELFENPDRVMEDAKNGLSLTENIYDVRLENCNPRFVNLPLLKRVLIRDLRAIHISKFISIEGIVRKVTEVRPKIVEAAFACTHCGKVVRVYQDNSNLTAPYECSACKSKRFIFLPDESVSVDSQRIKIQEYPENLKGGEQPQSIDVYLEGDITGVVNPGDRVVINGIVRAIPRGSGKRRLIHMDMFIEGNSIEILQQEYEEVEITEEDKKRIIELSEDENIYEKIVKSIAPSIYGYEDIKLAIALQLFGGVPKKLPDGTEIRGDIHILLVGDPGVAKCVDYDTEVILSDGSVVKIGDLINSELKNGNVREIDDGVYAKTNLNIISLDSKSLKSRVSKADIVWKREAPKIMYKIRTKTGRVIKVTPTHPFFTIKNGKFVTITAKELRRGDLIATPRVIPVFGKPQPIPNNFERLKFPEKTSPEFWRFVALFIASQSRNGRATLHFNHNDEKLVNEFFDYAKKLGLNPKLKNPNKGETAKEIIISSVVLYNFFDLLGIKDRSKEKRVPDLLFRCSKEEIKAFLSAFFDAKASVDKRRPKITVTSASEKLLRQIQHLLLRFGIISQLHETYRRATKLKHYRLTITGENALKFAKEIGFTVDSKIRSWKVKNNLNLDVIPDVSATLRETRRLLGLTQSECGVSRSTYQHLERGDRRPSRKTLAKIVEAFKSKLNGNKQAEFNVRFLELLTNSDIFWDEVVEIETYRPKHPFVYDLQVLEHHNFIANDIFVHNSQLLRYVHRIAPRSVYTTGKGTTTAGLCIAPDSLIFTEKGAFEIGKLVESNELSEFCGDVYVSKLQKPIAVQTINPTKLSFKPSSRLWKIKAPSELVKIVTQTGKEITTTPETKILTIENGKIIWKKAKDLEKDDFVATARRLEHKGSKPLTIELIKDLDVIVYGVEHIVKELIEKIKAKEGLTVKELSRKLGVNESCIYNWTNKGAKGSINLKTLLKLAEEANYDLRKIAEGIESFSQFHGHKIKLPTYLNKEFLYFAGLVAGDGDITKTSRGGYTIRFSSGNEKLRKKFKQLVKDLFGIEAKDQAGRVPAVKFSSKIVAHTLSKLGIPESPKSHRLDMSDILLSLPNEELSAFLRGLFDCDGTVIIRNNGSSYVELDTTSERLAKKLQLALLRFGIVAILRKRAVSGKDRKIVSRHDRYELRILGDSIERFAKFVGFEHPEKSKKLQRLLEIRKNQKKNTNINIIPDVADILKEIRTFYGLNAKKAYCSGFNEGRKNISRKTLRKAVKSLRKANVKNVRIQLPNELRLKIGEVVNHKDLNLKASKFYEYFKRRNKNIRIPYKVLEKVLKVVRNRDAELYDHLHRVMADIKDREKEIKAKLEYLSSLANSDILWERVKEKKVIKSPYEFVYDLTVNDSHSFIANGIVVHNTATAVRDEMDGRWTLEAGALVLADKGIALVDEIDKMRPDDRSALHEAMEQQTISVAKAGINAVLKARCALLGAANPKYGRFDRYSPIAEQINLSPTLLSRFDLIFVLTDEANVERDKVLAEYIVQTHELGEKLEKLRNVASEYDKESLESEIKKVSPIIDPDLLRKYIAYAKRTVFPVLSEEAKRKITEFYVGMRSKVKEDTPVPITARQLEAIIRLAEASARMRLSDRVEAEDVDRVLRIMKRSLEQIAIDPETGEIDIDYAFSGTSKTQRDRIMIIKRIIEELEREYEKGVPEEVILEEAEKNGINKAKAKELLFKLREKGELYCPRIDHYRIVHGY